MIKELLSMNITEQSYSGNIVDEVSELPIEFQEYVLSVMRGMVFTRELVRKETN